MSAYVREERDWFYVPVDHIWGMHFIFPSQVAELEEAYGDWEIFA